MNESADTSMTLNGKVAIITGAARGIGFGCAKAFGKAGAKVVVNDVDDEALQAALGVLQNEGTQAVGFPARVGSVDVANQLVEFAVKQFGSFDILINNAGILRDRMLHNMTEEEFDEVLYVSLRGTWACGQAALRHWRPLAKAEAEANAPKVRKIINITSASGLVGAIGQSNYAAAKMGIVGLTKSWAKELGPLGIRVNAIAPVALTRLTEGLLQDERATEQRIARLALRYYGTVDDVVPVFLFLASSASDYITGQILNVDGGLVI